MITLILMVRKHCEDWRSTELDKCLFSDAV